MSASFASSQQEKAGSGRNEADSDISERGDTGDFDIRLVGEVCDLGVPSEKSSVRHGGRKEVG
jgi:hypothetical protein